MIERVIVAGGGTGGHLFPGLAVVEELRRRVPSLEVLFVGTERGIEARVIPEMGERLECLTVTPLKGRSPVELAKSLGRLPAAGQAARRIVRGFRPDVVIGVGGYASGPMLAGAITMGVPTAVLEQNAHLGLTNRLLAKFVGRAYLTFEETASHFSAQKVRVTGNPVRRSFVQAAQKALVDPEGFEARVHHVLVMGGSQGARALNQGVPRVLGPLAQAQGLKVLHQCGRNNEDEVRALYKAAGVEADVRAFISDMSEAYAGAALIVARAGATSLAEICAVGRPSLLVPFPHAADDHQTKNARALEALGAARCLPESELTDDSLAALLRPLLQDASLRTDMSRAARLAGKPEAAASIVDDLVAWLDGDGAQADGSSGGPGEEVSGADVKGCRGRSTPSVGLGATTARAEGLRLRSSEAALPYFPVPRARAARMRPTPSVTLRVTEET